MKSLAVLLALVLPAFARIGETLAECKSRYGDPIEVDEKTSMNTFRKSGFIIGCQFFKDRAAAVVMMKEKPAGEFTVLNPEMTQIEIDTILKANGAGGEWVNKTPQLELVSKIWVNDTAKRRACYDTIKHTLTIFTDEFADFSNNAKSEKEKENLKGF